MESGPGLFAGTVFVVFGAGLLLWTGTRVRAGAPVVQGARSPRALVLAVLFGTVFLSVGGLLLASA